MRHNNHNTPYRADDTENRQPQNAMQQPPEFLSTVDAQPQEERQQPSDNRMNFSSAAPRPRNPHDAYLHPVYPRNPDHVFTFTAQDYREAVVNTILDEGSERDLPDLADYLGLELPALRQLVGLDLPSYDDGMMNAPQK